MSFEEHESNGWDEYKKEILTTQKRHELLLEKLTDRLNVLDTRVGTVELRILERIAEKIGALDVRLGKVEVKITIIAAVAGFIGSMVGQLLFSLAKNVGG